MAHGEKSAELPQMMNLAPGWWMVTTTKTVTATSLRPGRTPEEAMREAVRAERDEARASEVQAVACRPLNVKEFAEFVVWMNAR